LLDVVTKSTNDMLAYLKKVYLEMRCNDEDDECMKVEEVDDEVVTIPQGDVFEMRRSTMNGDSVDRVINGLRNMVESHGLW
jgi:hypothetical protein